MGTSKTPVFAMVQRGGTIRRQVVSEVTSEKLKAVILENIAPSATINSEEAKVYCGLAKPFAGHGTVNHSIGVYAKPDGTTTNNAESSFSLLKRGLSETFQTVSREHLHRYVAEFYFRWNFRKANDRERVVAAIKGRTAESGSGTKRQRPIIRKCKKRCWQVGKRRR